MEASATEMGRRPPGRDPRDGRGRDRRPQPAGDGMTRPDWWWDVSLERLAEEEAGWRRPVVRIDVEDEEEPSERR